MTRAIHLARLSNSHAACRGCVHRQDTLGLNAAQLRRLEQHRSEQGTGGPWQPEAFADELGNRLNAAVVRNVAMALAIGSTASLLSAATAQVVFAWDGRPQAAELQRAAVEGLQLAGSRVLHLGTATAALLARVLRDTHSQGGVLLANQLGRPHTASLSFWGPDARPLSRPGGLAELEQRARCPAGRAARRASPVQYEDAAPAYLDRMRPALHALRPLHIVWGVRDRVMRAWLEGLMRNTACERIELADQQFSRSGLARVVREQQAHLGVLFDGLGEGLTVVDELGNLVEPRRLATLVAGQPAREFPSPGGRESAWGASQGEAAPLADQQGRVWIAGIADGLEVFVRLLAVLSRGDTPLSRVANG
ncbi:MAG: hypothetical protein K1X74_04065 [Pirellulales bacterium]|nr:hypothetical protein [Pirellulales bacterium]